MSRRIQQEGWKWQEDGNILKLKLSLPNIKHRNSNYPCLLNALIVVYSFHCLDCLFVIDFVVKCFVAFCAYCGFGLLCILMQMCL